MIKKGKGKRMAIKIDVVKKLRELTNAGVADCKKALKEAGGDLDKAGEILKKKGAKLAEKKAGRETSEGLVEVYLHPGARIGTILELACETDFVARNELFKGLAHELAMQIASMDPSTVEVLLDQEYIRNPKKKVKDLIKETIAKFGENIKVKRFIRYELGEESS